MCTSYINMTAAVLAIVTYSVHSTPWTLNPGDLMTHENPARSKANVR